MKVPGSAALIPAAGDGLRLGLGPKALLRIGDRTLIEILVATLVPLVEQVLVAAPAGREADFRRLLGSRARVIRGGSERQDSIQALVAACGEELLLIQDVARPFASSDLCRSVLLAAERHGAAGAFVDPMVPVGFTERGAVARYWSRTSAGVFQAPQAFRRELLRQAAEQAQGKYFQSTAQMVIDAGLPLWRVEGDPRNIKITTALDWAIATKVIAPALDLN